MYWILARLQGTKYETESRSASEEDDFDVCGNIEEVSLTWVIPMIVPTTMRTRRPSTTTKY